MIDRSVMLIMILAGAIFIIVAWQQPITPSETITTHVYQSCPLMLEDKQIWPVCECIEVKDEVVKVQCWRKM